jgi:Thioredoxin-like domain
MNQILKHFFSVNDKEWYDTILSHVRKITSPAQESMLKLALSMRVYSPRVAMFSQIAHERGVDDTGCVAAVDLQGTLLCDPSQIESKVIHLLTDGNFFLILITWVRFPDTYCANRHFSNPVQTGPPLFSITLKNWHCSCTLC